MRRITLTWEDTKSGSLILVTPKYGLSEAGRPKALCRVRQNGTSVLGRYAAPDSQTEDAAKDRGILLEKETAAMLLGLLSQIRSEDRITLVSGYRSREEQVQIWEDTLEKEGEAFTRTYVAKPGHSEHESGLAVDLAESQEEIDFICPQFPREGICGEFRKKASHWGFTERYLAGKESVTGIGEEPWHFRYVGTPHALIMEERGLVLEEYIQLLRRHPYGERPLVWKGCGLAVEISFLPAVPGDRAQLLQREDWPWAVSGNNADGFIITRWNGTAIRERVMGKERAAG